MDRGWVRDVHRAPPRRLLDAYSPLHHATLALRPDRWAHRRRSIVRRTHLSLYYLAGYLLPAGHLLLISPTFSTKLLLSDPNYEEQPLRLGGLVSSALPHLLLLLNLPLICK